MQAKSNKARLVIAADWLGDDDYNWWFSSAMKKVAAGNFEVKLLGNANWYNEADRNNILGHLKYVAKHFLFALKIQRSTQPADVLFAWNQLTALLLAAAFRFTGSGRRLICQNFLYRSSSSHLFDHMRRWLYNYAIGYKHIYFSLQHPDLLTHYQQCGLQIEGKRTYFVPDCVPVNRVPDEIIQAAKQVTARNNLVFTGGEANRNWQLVFDLAEQLPYLNFCCVARRRFFSFEKRLPKNLEMHFDLPLTGFFQLMSKCTIVLIPIKERDNPAGLLLLFDAAVMGKPILSSDTPYIRQFVADVADQVIFQNEKDAVEKLKRFSAAATQHDHLLQAILKKGSIAHYTDLHLKQFLLLHEAF